MPVGPPADVAAWQPDDFRQARRMQDRRLAEALPALLARLPMDASLLPLLLELVSAEPAAIKLALAPQVAGAKPSLDGPPPPLSTNDAIAVLTALVESTAESAVTTLTDVVYGRRHTGLEDRRNLEIIAAGWGKSAQPAAQDVLFVMLLEPTSLRSVKPEENSPDLVRPISADEVQKLAWTAVQPQLNIARRQRLVDHLAKKETPAEHHKLFEPALMERRADNAAAWLTIWKSPAFDAKTRGDAERFLISDARWLIGELLGLPPNVDSGAPQPNLGVAVTALGGVNNAVLGGAGEVGSAPEPCPEVPAEKMPAHMAQLLWQRPILERFVDQAGQNPLKLVELIRVLTRFPTNDSRLLLKAAADRFASQVVLSAAGDVAPFASVIHDPGLLPILKEIPQIEDPAVHDERIGKTKKPPPRARNNRPPAAAPAVDPKQKSRYDWMALTEATVQTWNRRLLAAAEAQKQASLTDSVAPGSVAPPAGEPDASAKRTGADSDPFGTKLAARTSGAQLPIELHEDAQVRAYYKLVCPEEAVAKLPGVTVDPLVVHYVCIEEENRVGTLLGHYREQLKGAKVRPLAAQGRWIDYQGGGSQSGRQRSVDVIITPRDTAAAAAPADKEKEKKRKLEPLRVEILCVEIERPAGELPDAK